MALTWTAKPSGAVYRLTWTVPVVDGDSVATATLTVSDGDAVIDSYEIVDNGVVAAVSGGTDGTVTTITASAVTSDGETIAETIYLPIRASSIALANTVQDICAFALRKITGLGADADDAALEDMRERLDDMLAMWRMDGMDVGAVSPLALSDTLKVPDEFIAAIKHNLILSGLDLYPGYDPSPVTVELAAMGKILVRNRLFANSTLKIPPTLTRPVGTIGELFP